MPYATANDLPKDIRDKYSPAQQRAFVAAFNSAYDKYGSEERAFAVAHEAAQGVGSKVYSGFKVIGDNGWVAYYGTSFGPDRDEEFFTTDSLVEDVRDINKSGRSLELRFRHLPGTKHGMSKTVQMVGRFAVAVGEFDKSSYGQKIKQYYIDNPQECDGVSFGFRYLAKDKRVNTYKKIRAFEVSPLPRRMASNPYTEFVVKGSIMSKAAEKAFALALGDEEEASKIVQDALARTDSLEAAGVAYKGAPSDDGDPLTDAKINKAELVKIMERHIDPEQAQAIMTDLAKYMGDSGQKEDDKMSDQQTDAPAGLTLTQITDAVKTALVDGQKSIVETAVKMSGEQIKAYMDEALEAFRAEIDAKYAKRKMDGEMDEDEDEKKGAMQDNKSAPVADEDDVDEFMQKQLMAGVKQLMKEWKDDGSDTSQTGTKEVSRAELSGFELLEYLQNPQVYQERNGVKVVD